MQFRKRAAVVLAASASAVALMGAPAFAASAHDNSGPSSTWITSGNGSILGGNQIFIPINVPIDVCGNAIAILGIAGSAGCQGGASVSNSY
jgi:hypothetical protein